MKHSKLPWETNGSCLIKAKDQNIVSCISILSDDDTRRVEGKYNAAFIVKAVNNHYQLLEALIDLQADIGGGKKFCGHDFTCRCAWEKATEAIKQAEAE